MNESAMRADRGEDDKGKAFFNGLSQDHLDAFICSHSSRTSQGVSTWTNQQAGKMVSLVPIWVDAPGEAGPNAIGMPCCWTHSPDVGDQHA
jgi:hypothetical protein